MRSFKWVFVWLPATLWYGLIWRFSAQPVHVSDGASDELMGQMLDGLSPTYTVDTNEIQAAVQELLSFFIRKGAHMFLYFVLALLIWFALTRLLESRPKRAAATILLCAVLSALDEYHQTFVPGRSGEVRDVLVDLSGSLIAMLLFTLPIFADWTQKNLSIPWGPALLAGLLGTILLLYVTLSIQPLMIFVHRAADLKFFADQSTEESRALLESSAPVLRETLYLAACGLTSFVTVCLSTLSGQRKVVLLALMYSLLFPVVIALVCSLPFVSGLLIAFLGSFAALLLWRLFPLLRL